MICTEAVEMAIEDDFKQHGKRLITYDPRNILQGGKLVYDFLQRKGERPIVALGVAAFLIHIHTRMTKSDPSTVLELVNQFLARLKKDEAERGD